MTRRGFTLIEIIIVVSLVAVLSILATGWYSRVLTQNAVTNTANQITGSLRKAQVYAMSGRGDTNWGVAYNGNTVTLYKGTTFATRDLVWDESITVNSNINISGLTDIGFSRVTGLPSTVATIVVTSNSNVETITVNSQGGISQ